MPNTKDITSRHRLQNSCPIDTTTRAASRGDIFGASSTQACRVLRIFFFRRLDSSYIADMCVWQCELHRIARHTRNGPGIFEYMRRRNKQRFRSCSLYMKGINTFIYIYSIIIRRNTKPLVFVGWDQSSNEISPSARLWNLLAWRRCCCCWFLLGGSLKVIFVDECIRRVIRIIFGIIFR